MDSVALREVQHPLSLVAYFHKLMGHEHRTFEDKETVYAAKCESAPDGDPIAEWK